MTKLVEPHFAFAYGLALPMSWNWSDPFTFAASKLLEQLTEWSYSRHVPHDFVEIMLM